jgi:hypothetical protein
VVGFNAAGGIKRRSGCWVADVFGGQVLDHPTGCSGPDDGIQRRSPSVSAIRSSNSERRAGVYAVTFNVASVVGVEVLVCAVVVTDTELVFAPDAL